MVPGSFCRHVRYAVIAVPVVVDDVLRQPEKLWNPSFQVVLSPASSTGYYVVAIRGLHSCHRVAGYDTSRSTVIGYRFTMAFTILCCNCSDDSLWCYVVECGLWLCGRLLSQYVRSLSLVD